MARCVIFLCSLFFAGVLGAQGQWDVEVLDSGVPESLGAGERTVVRLTIANRGTRDWDPSDGFSVAAHWLTLDNKVVEWEGVRTPFNGVVAPGSTVTVEAALVAPGQAGTFLVQWDVLQEGAFWIVDRDPTKVVGSPVEVPRTFSFVQMGVVQPFLLRTGRTEQVRLALKNNGSIEWTSDGTFSVVARWRFLGMSATNADGPRTSFFRPVNTGDEVELEVVLQPPAFPGFWFLEWDLVHEGVCFFSERMGDSPPAALMLVIPSLPMWFLIMVLSVPAFFAVWWFFRPTLGDAGRGFRAIIAFFRRNKHRSFEALGGLIRRIRFSWIRRNPGVFWVAQRGDLGWLVLVPFIAERSVLDGDFGGGMVTFLCLSAVASLVALAGRRFRPWLAWGVGVVMVAVFVIDRIYQRFFSDLPSIGSLEIMGQTDEISRSIGSLLNGFDGFLLLAGLAGGLVALVAWRIGQDILPFRRRAVVAALVCGVAGTGLWWAAERPIHRQVFRRVFVAQDIGVAAAHILDIGRTFRGFLLRTTISDAEVRRLEEWFRETKGDRCGGGATFGVARDMNLVMIQAESVQAFVIGLQVGDQLVMPNLTRWAAEGLWFTEVSDQTGHGRSSDAELITQTSLLALTDGAAAFKTATNHFTSLAGVLRDRGYETISAVPFDGAFWNRVVTHRAYGYATNLFAPDFEPGRRIGWGLNDRGFLQQMGDRMLEAPRPFCVWMLTLSLHHPFEGFPDDLEELDVGKWDEGPVGEYLHTMHYLDQALGDLERRLASEGLLQETLIVVWGDHDAGFEWTPEIAELMGVSSDQIGWYRSQRIPLIIKAPQRLGLTKIVNRPSGHVDVAPTIAGLLGIDSSAFAWMGRNVLGDIGEVPVVGEYGCWTTPSHVFIQGESGTLTDGRCLENTSLNPEAVDNCEVAFRTARERVAVSQEVLRYDLQERLSERLRMD